MNHLGKLIAVIGLTAGAATAQPPGPPAGGLLPIDDLAILLDLDAYQKGELERVLAEEREARRAAREERTASDGRPTREEMLARREQQREQLLGKLRNTLTEQQIAKLEILMDRGGGRGRRGPGAAL